MAAAAGITITPMDPDEGAANVLTEKYFRDLATGLGSEWESLATHLDFRKSEIEKMKMNNHLSVNNQIFDMLSKWRQSLGTIKRSHQELLAQSLKKVDRNDLAVKLEGMKLAMSSSEIPHGHINHQQNPSGGSTEMSFVYTDPDCKINVQNLKITGKDNAVFVGSVKDAVFNFN